MSIRVFAADDHPIFLEGLCTVLSFRDPELELVGSARDGDEVLAKIEEARPDVLLLDILMPKRNGIEAARELTRTHPEIRILMLSTYQDSHLIRDAIHAGARGYLLKETPADQIIEAVKAVYAGNLLLSPEAFASIEGGSKRRRRRYHSKLTDDRFLFNGMTDREKEVLRLMVEGYDNKDIARTLSIREKTVRNYVVSIYDIIGIHKRIDVILWALDNGLIDID